VQFLIKGILLRTLADGTGATTTYDSLGRISGVSNALGAFSYSYVDASGRLAGITAPTSPVLTQTFAYYNAAGDLRLQEILNKTGSSTNLSKFDFTYNGVGTIASLTEAVTGTAVVTNTHAYGYDAVDQLTGHTVGGTSTNAYTYDKAGNRLKETTPGGSTLGSFNNLNQLTLYGTAVNTTVAGTVSKLSDITILANGISASVTGTSSFSATMPLFGGTTNTVSVTALDTSGNQRTNKYTYTPSGGASGLIYDANGNVLTDENGNTYKWDARNRLTAIIYGTASPAFNTHTEFTYDGLDRRVQVAERTGTAVSSGTFTSTKNYLWVGSRIAEERNSGNSVQKRFFPQGEQQSGTAYYYTRDQLGSVRELMDASGNIAARYSYDPYGKTTKVSGTPDSTFQYAGYYAHSTSGLYLTKFRAYDANTGRWLSRDPIAEKGGMNLYGYAQNEPINENDPSGLWAAGRIVAASAEGGVVTGGGVTGSAGFGAFVDSNGAVTGGAFAAGGAFVGNPLASAVYPPATTQRPWVLGASAGVGTGSFVSNANTVCDLKGPFNQFNINTPWMSVSFSWGTNADGKPIWVVSVTTGKGEGLSVSSYPTTTVVTPTLPIISTPHSPSVPVGQP